MGLGGGTRGGNEAFTVGWGGGVEGVYGVEGWVGGGRSR